ncbi:hypothetical protein BGZ96_004293 [Linnemannia gamsii]|uniref:Uncharacterized protein n=1 Tax=Linnemannia gamsii TaxID=64522 RepID=A0ABQ7JIA9_9FUNG|nr:hypothetical protein BGZ96_004293 [Linnemannia gamsii]
MEHFGPLSFDALMESAETLEELTVEHWGIMEESCFLELLNTAKNLRRLGGPADGVIDYDTYEVVVNAYAASLEHDEGTKKIGLGHWDHRRSICKFRSSGFHDRMFPVV